MFESVGTCRVYAFQKGSCLCGAHEVDSGSRKAREEQSCPVQTLPALEEAWAIMKTITSDADRYNMGIGSTIFAVKPGDGSIREQAASCQKVLGG